MKIYDEAREKEEGDVGGIGRQKGRKARFLFVPFRFAAINLDWAHLPVEIISVALGRRLAWPVRGGRQTTVLAPIYYMQRGSQQSGRIMQRHGMQRDK